ncbi:unnamed protein product [Closterium sp. NIES-54]
MVSGRMSRVLASSPSCPTLLSSFAAISSVFPNMSWPCRSAPTQIVLVVLSMSFNVIGLNVPPFTVFFSQCPEYPGGLQLQMVVCCSPYPSS